MFQWFTPKQSFCMRRAVAISHVLSIKGISFHSWAKTRWWPENKLNLAGFQSHFFKDVFFKDGHHNLHKPSELLAWSLGIGQKLNHWFQTSMLDPKIVNPRATVQLVDRFLGPPSKLKCETVVSFVIGWADPGQSRPKPGMARKGEVSIALIIVSHITYTIYKHIVQQPSTI